MRVALLYVFSSLLIARCVGAQVAPRDSAFQTGACTPGATPKVNWDSVVTAPEMPARPTRESVLRVPSWLLGQNGAYAGVATAAMVIDKGGQVVAGTVSIETSTDPRLSAWLCDAVPALRFEPARVNGVAVVSILQQPYRYLLPPRGKASPE